MDTITPIDEAYIYEGSVIISQTDLKGIITYANSAFCEVTGYDMDEIIGKPRNFLRHPDMPKIVFEKLWSTISKGQVWNGLIKNLRKDGRYYWAETEIMPIKDENGVVIGYISTQRPASEKSIQENEEIYKRMLETEN